MSATAIRTCERSRIPVAAIKAEIERLQQKDSPVVTDGVRVSFREPALRELLKIQQAENQRVEDEDDHDLFSIEMELRSRCRIEKFNALEIGRLYYTAKRIIGQHLDPEMDSTFDQWIESVKLHSRSTVFSYIRVYRVCLGRHELVEAIPATMLQVICEAKFPEDLREAIFERGGTSATVERVKEIAERVRAGEISKNAPQVQNLLADLDYQGMERNVKTICGHLASQATKAKAELQKLLQYASSGDAERGIRATINRRIAACETFIQAME